MTKRTYIGPYMLDTQTRRREIIKGRLRGESTVVLSMRLGISRESVCKAYRALPKRPTSNTDALYLRLPPIEESTICDICMDYLNGASEEKLMKKYKMSLENLMACFYAVTDRKVCYNLKDKHQKFVFSSVIEKMQTLNLSMPILADRFDQTIYSLELFMKGWEYLPYDVADKIASELNLSVSDICKDIMAVDESGTEYLSNDKALLHRLAKIYFSRAVSEVAETSKEAETEAVYWAYYMVYERVYVPQA